MNNALITVIIPVYNVEKYLERCMASVLEQSYTNLQILLVDDGSTDNCPQLCDSYALQDNRVHVIHKQNGGLSDARNAGLEIASGEYVTFLDSDDWISLNCIEIMYNECCKYKADIAIIDTIETSDTVAVKKRYSDGFKLKKEYTPQEAMYVIFTQRGFNTGVGGKLYKHTLIEQFRFTKGILYEDIDVLYKIFDKASKIVFSDKAQYYYYQREGSIVHAEFDARHFILLDISSEILKFVDQKYPELHDAAVCRSIFSDFLILSRIKGNRKFKKEQIKICDSILERQSEVYHNKEINLKQKIKVTIVWIFRKLRRI